MKISELLNISADEILNHYSIGQPEPTPGIICTGFRSIPIGCEISETLHKLSPRINRRFILEINNALVLGGAFRVIDWSRKSLVHHPFIDWTFENIEEWKKNYDLEVPSNAQIIRGKSLILDGVWSLPYFHFISETLGKIYLTTKLRGFEGIDNIFLTTRGNRYATDWCDLLDLNVMPLPNHPILCESAIVPSYSQDCVNFSPYLIGFINQFFPQEKNNRDSANKIYISRKGTRRVLNEMELINCLKKFGFKTILLEELDVQSQVEFFRNAEYIVAPHGAGLTNLAFSNKKNKKIIELFGKSYVNGCYCALAACIDADYFYYISSNNDQNGNYFVDTESIESYLKKII
jgi:capsular polysaccharide biosynthesis protein